MAGHAVSLPQPGGEPVAFIALQSTAGFGPGPASVAGGAASIGVGDKRRLQEFVDQYLGVLLEHDGRQGTQFVRTLEAFHAHSDNPRLAAAALFVHVNTLKYRLSRIEALSGFDLHRISDRFNMYIALYALRFLEPDRHSLLPSDFHLLPEAD